jgi:hypothetical protein
MTVPAKVAKGAKNIRGVTKGSVTPKGMAPGQGAHTPQKVKAPAVAGVAYSNGGKIRPQRG